MDSVKDKISIHNSDGWQGQYERMRRWDKRLENYNCPIVDRIHLDDFLDTLYTTYQNIFHLKDWLNKENIVDKKTLNDFIKQNKEMGLCRDIANGTKHFALDNNFSIGHDFFIMSIWDPFNKEKYWSDKKIRVISKAGLFDPFGLSKKCILLWTHFLIEKGLLDSDTLTEVSDINISAEHFAPNIQTVYGQPQRRRKNSH